MRLRVQSGGPERIIEAPQAEAERRNADAALCRAWEAGVLVRAETLRRAVTDEKLRHSLRDILAPR